MPDDFLRSSETKKFHCFDVAARGNPKEPLLRFSSHIVNNAYNEDLENFLDFIKFCFELFIECLALQVFP
jgi:hypothetical protein